MSILVKKPGHDFTLQKQDFMFDYKQAYKEEEFVDAYEKLLLDMIRGDQTLFVTTKEIFDEWLFVEPILKVWSQNKPSLFKYMANKIIDNDLPIGGQIV